MVKGIKPKSKIKLMRINAHNQEVLGSLCEKGMSYDDALTLVLKTLAKTHKDWDEMQ